MKEIRLVADSSADVRSAGDHEIFVAPLKISTKDMSFTDDEALDVGAMVDHLSKYKGRSGTSCPNTEDWIAAFGGAERVIVCTITSNLSGSYNSACLAKAEYEAGDPERRVYVIDSLSTGPECALILRKLSELIDEGLEYEEIIDVINEYKASTGLLFMLKSMNNLANNGRVSHLAASVAKVIGISAIGKASDVGTLEMLHKCLGEARALATMFSELKEAGLRCGRVSIAHCQNEAAANKLSDMILKELPDCEVEIHTLGGLCSFYAERGGLLVGFEKR
ncbi:MAG: DegV family protein [Clostridia bacterium]|nr:DegV family protein [Clostridia bacterium]